MPVAPALIMAVASIGSALISKSSADKAASVQQKAADQAASAAERQQALAEEQWNRYKETYAPLEDEIVQESRDYGSEANKTKAAEEAAGNVATSFANVRQRLGETPGLDPSSDKYLKEIAKTGVQEAATSAAAQTGARRDTAAMGSAMEKDAVALGKGLPATSVAALNGSSSSATDAARIAQVNAATAGRNTYSMGKLAGDFFGNPSVAGAIGGMFKSGSNPYQADGMTNDFGGVNGGNAMDMFQQFGTSGD